MEVVVTDSGLGGLSVCALLARGLADRGVAASLRYLNAVPRDGFGYNDMPTRALRLENFRRALAAAEARWRPDLVVVACNSLSALLPDLPPTGGAPRLGIVDAGRALIAEFLAASSAPALVFATPSTVAEGAYLSGPDGAPFPQGRVVQTACPGLATAISNDPAGTDAGAKIQGFAALALAALRGSRHSQGGRGFGGLAAFLGCTHYGYREALFMEALKGLGVADPVALNPNRALAEEALRRLAPKGAEAGAGAATGAVAVEFIGRYPLPAAESATLAAFLAPLDPATAASVASPVVDPGLFDPDFG